MWPVCFGMEGYKRAHKVFAALPHVNGAKFSWQQTAACPFDEHKRAVLSFHKETCMLHQYVGRHKIVYKLPMVRFAERLK